MSTLPDFPSHFVFRSSQFRERRRFSAKLTKVIGDPATIADKPQHSSPHTGNSKLKVPAALRDLLLVFRFMLAHARGEEQGFHVRGFQKLPAFASATTFAILGIIGRFWTTNTPKRGFS